MRIRRRNPRKTELSLQELNGALSDFVENASAEALGKLCAKAYALKYHSKRLQSADSNGVTPELLEFSANNCGNGAGGFKGGNTCGKRVYSLKRVLGTLGDPGDLAPSEYQTQMYAKVAERIGGDALAAMQQFQSGRRGIVATWDMKAGNKQKVVVDWLTEHNLASDPDYDFLAVMFPREPITAPTLDWRPPETISEDFYANYNPRQPRDDHGRWARAGASQKAEPRTRTRHKPYAPDVERDHDGDGVTEHARVGVPAYTVPPPPPIPRLANLTPQERRVEKKFADAYEADPDGVARKFREVVRASTKPGEPVTFGTDDAKVLTSAWTHRDKNTRAFNRATLNLALHQTANAVSKRAFLQHLDSLRPGDEVMVTVGGCGAGKGYALKNVPEALAVKQRCKVVWDSAGDQNATENPWIQREAEARGLKVNYVYVHADAKTQWAHPERGVVKRAADPNDGRMVDAKVFADSYAIGARNHKAFYEANRSNPNASFVFLSNKGKPELIPGIPDEALEHDRKELARYAAGVVAAGDAPAHVKRGALSGIRVWGDE